MGGGGAVHLFVYNYCFFCACSWRLRLKSAPTLSGFAYAVSLTSVPELEADHGLERKWILVWWRRRVE